jgi:hypothetical protein
MSVDSASISLIPQGANFDVIFQGENVGSIQFGLHLGQYGIVIQSGTNIFAYSVNPQASVHCKPDVAVDQLLKAFRAKNIEHRILHKGHVECAEYQKTYMMLAVNKTAIMMLSLHPITNFPGCIAYTPKDEAGNQLGYEYYTYPVCEKLSQPDLNLNVMAHSTGWCGSRF